MRSYFFVESASGPAALSAIPGCKYVSDAGRGHGPELWFDGAKMPQDYPAKVALVTALDATRCYQIVPLVEDGGALLKLVTEGAAKAGITVYADAKALEVAKPAVADEHLYPQAPTGGKRAGSALQVKPLAGDDAVACASAVAAEPIELGAEEVKPH